MGYLSLFSYKNINCWLHLYNGSVFLSKGFIVVATDSLSSDANIINHNYRNYNINFSLNNMLYQGKLDFRLPKNNKPRPAVLPYAAMPLSIGLSELNTRPSRRDPPNSLKSTVQYSNLRRGVAPRILHECVYSTKLYLHHFPNRRALEFKVKTCHCFWNINCFIHCYLEPLCLKFEQFNTADPDHLHVQPWFVKLAVLQARPNTCNECRTKRGRARCRGIVRAGGRLHGASGGNNKTRDGTTRAHRRHRLLPAALHAGQQRVAMGWWIDLVSQSASHIKWNVACLSLSLSLQHCQLTLFFEKTLSTHTSFI